MNTMTWKIPLAASLLAGLVFAGSAIAGPVQPKGDWFNANPGMSTPAVPSTGSGAGKAESVAGGWYKAFDNAINSHMPSAADRAIISRPINQDADRLQEWIATASKVAKNYRELSAMLKAMPVPNTLVGVKEFRDLRADWYADAANVYEDILRARKPAKTIEELDTSLNEINERCKRLKSLNTNIVATDRSLRKTFKVHMNDALWSYVSTK